MRRVIHLPTSISLPSWPCLPPAWLCSILPSLRLRLGDAPIAPSRALWHGRGAQQATWSRGRGPTGSWHSTPETQVVLSSRQADRQRRPGLNISVGPYRNSGSDCKDSHDHTRTLGQQDVAGVPRRSPTTAGREPPAAPGIPGERLA